jgi:hypothetical protein
VKISDVLDQLAFDSGDDGSGYTAASRRWLNAARADIADECMWRQAMRSDAQIVTAAATTSGLYDLTDSSTGKKYQQILSDHLHDETNNRTIRHESFGSLRIADADKSVTGKPDFWADAGMDASGNREIYLWPVPDGSYTISFPGYLLLTDITESDDTATEDPFFGPISPWFGTFVAGARFYHDLNNNEDAAITARQEFRFRERIRIRKKNNRVSPTAAMSMRVVNTRQLRRVGARANPAHYDNSQWR